MLAVSAWGVAILDLIAIVVIVLALVALHHTDHVGKK